jgi:hypothetical protein
MIQSILVELLPLTNSTQSKLLAHGFAVTARYKLSANKEGNIDFENCSYKEGKSRKYLNVHEIYQVKV